MNYKPETMQMSRYTYFLLRLPIAFSMLGHGLVRLPKLKGFSNWMLTSMEKSFIPDAVILPFSYLVPFAELIIGLLIIIGLFTRQALAAGLLLMTIFIFGNTSIENWDPLTSQLVHAGYFGALLLLIGHNYFSVDEALGRK